MSFKSKQAPRNQTTLVVLPAHECLNFQNRAADYGSEGLAMRAQMSGRHCHL
ncbi:MAG: hypothetical protein RL572_700 [Pseudomonadota bacterium]|jgi:hypothetical protein